MKKTIMEKICTGCLVVLLVAIIATGVKRVWLYYSGPMHTIDNYIKAINNERYDDIYSLLDESTLDCKWNKEFIVSYYQNYYAQYSGEERVQAGGWINTNCYLITSNIEGEVENLELVTEKVNGEWKIKYPFPKYNLGINAPFGCNVYVDGERLSYIDNVGYVSRGLLKGEYEIKVKFDNNEFSDYEDRIKLYNDRVIDMPYNTGNIEVKTLDCMKVKVKNKYSENEYTHANLNNILVGEYRVKCYHPQNYISEIDKDITIMEGDNSIDINGYILSDEGKRKYEEFIAEYYQDYAKGIDYKSQESLHKYFEDTSREYELEQFSKWYIDNKDVISSTVSYNIGDFSLNDEGCINANIIETVELVNKEKDGEKNYKVVIEWNIDVDINDDEWKISHRTIKQSIVAVEDSNGNWIEV